MTSEELLQLIKRALLIKNNVTMDDSVDTLKQWDSVGHLSILVAIDKKSGGKASKIKKLTHCQTVRQLAKVLKENKLLKD